MFLFDSFKIHLILLNFAFVRKMIKNKKGKINTKKLYW